MSMFSCFLLYFLSMLASLGLGFAMLCALPPPPPPRWSCSCVVTSIPLVPKWGVTTCETHPRDVGVLDCEPFSPPCNVYMLALLAWCHPFGFLCFFASLHACLYVHAWVCVSSIRQSNGPTDTQSKPTFILLGHPLLFDNMHFTFSYA